MSKKILLIFFLVIPIFLIQPILPVSAGSLSVYGCHNSPSTVVNGQTVTISCSVSSSQMSDFIVSVYWTVNGGTQQSKQMSGTEPTYSASIGSFAIGDVVNYFVRAIGEDTNYLLVSDRDPYSGTYAFTVQGQYISWSSPSSGATINFSGENNPFTFNFDFTYYGIDDAHLKLGSYDIDILTSGGTKTTSVSIDYASNLDGSVTAQLVGYKSGSQVASDSRSFTFNWVQSVDIYTLETGNQAIGKKLYLILHDPSGDNSYSNFAQTQTISMTAGIEITAGASLTETADASLFGVGVEASAGVSLEATVGASFGYSMSVGTALTSSQESNDPGYIGPGRGDYYWGEGWVLNWRIDSTKTVYWDGTEVYTQPQLHYGIIRSMELFTGDQYAPTDWKDLNPVFNNYAGVIWLNSKAIQGGAPYTATNKYETTATLSTSLSVTVTDSTKVKLGWASAKLELSLKTSLSSSISAQNEEILGYTLYDDDSSDFVKQDVGIDNQFGTFIFRTDPTSMTSSPLENGTLDYQAPIIGNPTVNLDTDGISPSPSQSDSPLVTVPISDEGGISKAVVWYSTNNGVSVGRVNMSEQTGNQGTWQANIPKFPHGTVVQWYIEVWDNSNNAATKKDVNGNNYEYTVINRIPTVQVISPNGGETLSGTTTLSWVGNDPDKDTLTYSLGYNLDNKGWKLIVSGLTNNSFIWNLSKLPDSDNVLIKVIADDGFGGVIEDTSDFVFSINNIDIPVVSLMSPVSGLTYSGSLTVNWDLSDVDNLVTSFDLYYSTNSGLDWVLLVDNLPKPTKSYDWNTSTVIFTQNARIKIISLYQLASGNEFVEDLSDIFKIDNRPTLEVSLVYPNGGELLADSVSISWTVNTQPGVTYLSSLEYSLDGVTWYEIDNGISGNSYNWITHDLSQSTNYRIRVAISGNYQGFSLIPATDISEGSFTINPDHENPVISPPADISYDNSTSGNKISWTLSDKNPLNYSILLDESYLIFNETWVSGDTIEFGIDGLSVGTHEYLIVVEDYWGQQASDSVTVTVTFTPPQPPTYELKVTSPNGGEVITNNNLELSWQLENPDSLPTTFSLYYSSDDGNTWNLITEGLSTTKYQWNITELANGVKYYVKVKATTSYNDKQIISEDRSDNAFSIAHNLSGIDTSSLPIPSSPGYTLLIVLLVPLLMTLKRRKRR